MALCHNLLLNKVKGANCVAAMWKRADRRSPASYSPDGHGWNLRDGSYDLAGYDGEQVPRNLSQLLDSNIQAPDAADDEDNEAEGSHLQDSEDSDSDDVSQF